jgi:hypothetical protein
MQSDANLVLSSASRTAFRMISPPSTPPWIHHGATVRPVQQSRSASKARREPEEPKISCQSHPVSSCGRQALGVTLPVSQTLSSRYAHPSRRYSWFVLTPCKLGVSNAEMVIVFQMARLRAKASW